MEKRFNLLNDPWIRVIDKDGKEKEVSMLSLFKKAHEYNALSGELETQNVAVTRFLIAVVISVIYKFDINGLESLITNDDGQIGGEKEVYSRWKYIWQKGCFPYSVIEKYLYKYEDNFYLIHPDRPFLQNNDLAFGTEYTSMKTFQGDIKESNNVATRHHFSQREDYALDTLSLAEATRWLLFNNAYGINLKAKINGTNISSFIGYAGNLGTILAQGNNLFETLMLNSTVLKDGKTLWGTPKPVWEREEIEVKLKKEIAVPDNLAELYTLPARFFQLTVENDRVVKYKAMLGEHYDDDQYFIEQLTMWRTIKDKDSADKDATKVIPKLINANSLSWREFPALMVQPESKDRKSGLLLWLEKLEKDHCVPKNSKLRIKMIGQQYDGMKYCYVDSNVDELSMSYDLLLDKGEAWIRLITKEVQNCGTVASSLESYAKKLASSLNIEGKFFTGLSQKYYEAIDLCFRNWLIDISSDDEEKEMKQEEWQKISCRIALREADIFTESLDITPFSVRSGTTTPYQLYEKLKKDLMQIYPAFWRKEDKQ